MFSILVTEKCRRLLTSLSDLDKVTNTPTLYPIIETLYEATGSKAGTVFMMMIIYFVIGCSQFNILASVSRLTWYALFQDLSLVECN